MLHTQVFEQIREFVIGTIDPVAPRLSQACGAPVKDVKSCKLRLYIGDQAKDVAVFVCPSVAHDMILGNPKLTSSNSHTTLGGANDDWCSQARLEYDLKRRWC